jgi:hypothetical protein
MQIAHRLDRFIPHTRASLKVVVYEASRVHGGRIPAQILCDGPRYCGVSHAPLLGD